jgi:hypothetical protein
MLDLEHDFALGRGELLVEGKWDLAPGEVVDYQRRNRFHFFSLLAAFLVLRAKIWEWARRDANGRGQDVRGILEVSARLILPGFLAFLLR